MRAVVMEIRPPVPLMMAEAGFPLEVLIIALDTPAHLGAIDEPTGRHFRIYRMSESMAWARLKVHSCRFMNPGGPNVYDNYPVSANSHLATACHTGVPLSGTCSTLSVMNARPVAT
jgi:hypothetical protein